MENHQKPRARQHKTTRQGSAQTTRSLTNASPLYSALRALCPSTNQDPTNPGHTHPKPKLRHIMRTDFESAF